MKFSKKQIISLGFIFHLLAAYFSVGYHQCDELFQIFEFAGYKLGLNKAEELPWEFASHMRSGIEPFFVYTITQLFHAINIYNPFYIATFLRVLMALASFFVTLRLLSLFEEELINEKTKVYLWAFGLLFWCLPYFHARLSSENFSSLFFIYGLYLLLKSLKEKKPTFTILLAGFVFGISFVCRFQFAFMIAGLIAWLMFVERVTLRYYVGMFLGILAALILGALIDKWLYQQWTLSWCNYLSENLFQNKASNYGESPFYFYFAEALLQLIPPFSIVIIVSIIGFWIKFKTHFLTWITLPFIVLHFFVAHKELRFLFPVLNFIPFMVLFHFQTFEHSQNKLVKLVKSNSFVKFSIVVNCIVLCFYTIKPADDTSASLEKIYTLVQGQSPILFYEGTSPYNNQASLSYFRNPSLTLVDIDKETELNSQQTNTYYFSEKFNESQVLEKNGQRFTKIYSNFPYWFKYLNFNGWLNRAYSFNIYKSESSY